MYQRKEVKKSENIERRKGNKGISEKGKKAKSKEEEIERMREGDREQK